MEVFLGAFTREWEQRKAAYLHERLIGKAAGEDEEEPRRRSAAADGGLGRHRSGADGGGHESLPRHAPATREMSTRFAGLASGSQPAVVKVTSFGGWGRLGAIAGYISRNGEVAMENQAGEQLRGREAIAALSDDWAHLTADRAESRDIATFRVDISGGPGEGKALLAWARDVANTALGDRSFAIAVEERQGLHRIEGVVVLRDRRGERLTADAKAEEIVKARMVRQGADAVTCEFHFTGYGNGVEYGTARLRRLVERHEGAVENDRGEPIADARRAGDLVQLEWRGELHSRKSRDVMHLVISARAGTDVEAFRSAAREFLASEFAHHRYVFSLHDPTRDPRAEQHGGKRPHVHVHAIVAMRSEDGERVETSIAAFRRWREGLAESARAYGIRMEMTDRREQAAAPAFTRKQVRPVSRRGRTEHEGTSNFAGQRYGQKRDEIPSAARTARSLSYTQTVRGRWSDLAQNAENTDVKAFARAQLSRLESVGKRLENRRNGSDLSNDSGSRMRAEWVRLFQVTEVDTMRAMTRSEFEAYEKRVEAALFHAEHVLPENRRGNFDEMAAAAREHVDVRREIMEQAEKSGGQVPKDTDAREPDDPSRRWNEAVARHGLEAVETGTVVMNEVEYYRERIDSADDVRADQSSLQARLNFELAKAAALGASGNTYIREIAEGDGELRIAIEAVERYRDRARGGAGGVGERDAAARSVERGEGPKVHDEVINHSGERNDRRVSDTSRTSPAERVAPRSEELERDGEPGHDDNER